MTLIIRSSAPPRGFKDSGDEAARLYLRPVGLLWGEAAERAIATGRAHRVAGGSIAYTACELFIREASRIGRCVLPLPELAHWAREQGENIQAQVKQGLGRLSRQRPPFAGLGADQPLVMGIVNVTPDSFSDGGEHFSTDSAIVHGMALIVAGADILDIGGESTRPGAAPVSEADELNRVVPVVQGLVEGCGGRRVPISIDTRRSRVMAAALAAGASIVNDVSALTHDPASLEVVAASGASVVLMHMLGDDPRVMQDAPSYGYAPLDILDYLDSRVNACVAAGIPRSRIAVDPGVGFGKTTAQNLDILRDLGLLHTLGCPVLVGVSRKSFLGKLCAADDPRDRLGASLAAGLAVLAQGAQVLRVHDVAETRQAVTVWSTIRA